MNRARLFTSLAVTAAAAAASALYAPGVSAAPGSLEAAKTASARYHSVQQALRDGFSGEHEPCVSSPAGAMGVHYTNGPRFGDPSLDALKPEGLLYLPDAEGELELVGVEYLVPDADQDLSTDGDRPSLFGQAFAGPMPGHASGMPIHYDLHVWFWHDNPDGLFAPFNPSISCP